MSVLLLSLSIFPYIEHFRCFSLLPLRITASVRATDISEFICCLSDRFENPFPVLYQKSSLSVHLLSFYSSYFHWHLTHFSNSIQQSALYFWHNCPHLLRSAKISCWNLLFWLCFHTGLRAQREGGDVMSDGGGEVWQSQCVCVSSLHMSLTVPSHVAVCICCYWNLFLIKDLVICFFSPEEPRQVSCRRGFNRGNPGLPSQGWRLESVRRVRAPGVKV